MDVEERLRKLEEKVDFLGRLVFGGVVEATPPQGNEGLRLFGSMTEKQHGTAQMLCEGKSNWQIAQRFGVTENTAKVYVRTLAKRFGEHSRGMIAMKYKAIMDGMTEEVYEGVAGISKSWVKESDDVKSGGKRGKAVRRRDGGGKKD